jgi:hypothetical protein
VSRGTQVPATSLSAFTYGALTLYGPSFQNDSASGLVGNLPALNRAGPTTPIDPKTDRFGLFRVRSPLLTKSLNCFLFLQVLRWFTSLSSLPRPYVFRSRILHVQRSGLPHSEISGSTAVCAFPKLFAAYHVLHRLPSPRHPPYALSSLIITCLWRSLYLLLASGPPSESLRYAAFAASLQPSGLPTPESVEFAHQYSVVKDLKSSTEAQLRSRRISDFRYRIWM